MSTCSDFKDKLLLDVYSELTSAERIVWEKHLAGCGDCRQEKAKLLALIQNVKEGGAVSALTSEEEQLLSSQVQRTLRMGKPDVASKRLGWRIAPAFGACVIIVFAGWFSLNDFKVSDTLTVNSNGVPEEQIISNNEDLLQNMELLEEMEELEQLVNFLDKQRLETSLLERGENADRVRAHV